MVLQVKMFIFVHQCAGAYTFIKVCIDYIIQKQQYIVNGTNNDKKLKD